MYVCVNEGSKGVYECVCVCMCVCVCVLYLEGLFRSGSLLPDPVNLCPCLGQLDQVLQALFLHYSLLILIKVRDLKG